MATGGLDIGKHSLVAALDTSDRRLEVANTLEGWRAIAAWMREAGVERIGMEPSGGYERRLRAHLKRAGFTVLLLKPGAPRALARMLGRRAKNDTLDAGLIARCTAILRETPPERDPRIEALHEEMRLLEQLEADHARWKTRLEHYQTPRLRRRIETKIRHLGKERDLLRKALAATLRRSADLARKLDLLLSIPGLGERTALALMIHLPELGTLTREQLAALVGVAPFDCDSGTIRGQRRIAGGRAPLRKALFAGALPAVFHWNDDLKAIYARLIANGKSHKTAMIACIRKLVIYANALIKHDRPWQNRHSQI